MGQVVNFFSEKSIELKNLVRGLNSMLPVDIRVMNAFEADPLFHARYSVKSKTYVYCILNAPYHSPFYARYSWHIPFKLDVPLMHETIKFIVGKYDFSAFKKKDEVYRSPVREVLRAGVKRKGEFVYVVVEATGFLRYMVRNIVGTLVPVGSGKLTKDHFKEIMESKDRVKAGPTAPPHGLFLRRIKY
jgi:tRNA pseudouridine38-40 synthase